MFDSVVLRKTKDGVSITAGQIAEALLFYQRVQLIVERGTLVELAKQIGLDWLMVLFRREDLTAVYCEESLCTSSDDVGSYTYHKYTAIHLAGHKDLKLESVGKVLQFDLERNGFDKKRVKRFVKDFLDFVPVRKLSGNHFISGGISESATNSILDATYTRRAIKKIVVGIPGGYELSDNYEFEVIQTNGGFRVLTDIDFEVINKKRLLIGIKDPFTISHLLTFLQDARADIIFASYYGGDFITSSLNSSIIQIQHQEILRRAQINQDSLNQFHEIILPDTPRLSEVIDAGNRSIKEFIHLLEKSSRFKHWLKATSPDEGLVREYLQSVTAEGWIQGLPAKTVRYLINLASSALTPDAGVAVGVVDGFIVDKLLGGWKPNHFINDRLVPFHKR